MALELFHFLPLLFVFFQVFVLLYGCIIQVFILVVKYFLKYLFEFLKLTLEKNPLNCYNNKKERIKMTIAEAFKRFRKSRNLTQKQVADELGITPQAYSVYENKTVPTATILIKIADTFNVSTDYLLGRIDNPQPFKTEIDFDEQESNELTVAAENDRILDYHQTLANILAKQGIKI